MCSASNSEFDPVKVKSHSCNREEHHHSSSEPGLDGSTAASVGYLIRCLECNLAFAVHVCCYRNNKYCSSSCQKANRIRKQKEHNLKYRQSEKGKINQRKRTGRLRERKRTHLDPPQVNAQSPKASPDGENLPASPQDDSDFNNERNTQATSAQSELEQEHPCAPAALPSADLSQSDHQLERSQSDQRALHSKSFRGAATESRTNPELSQSPPSGFDGNREEHPASVTNKGSLSIESMSIGHILSADTDCPISVPNTPPVLLSSTCHKTEYAPYSNENFSLQEPEMAVDPPSLGSPRSGWTCINCHGLVTTLIERS
jgi:hypothetical protein